MIINNSSNSNHNYVSLELINTFYHGYIEYNHNVNFIIQNISFNKEIGKSYENEFEYQQSKIKQKIHTLEKENNNLKEQNKPQLKIIELLSAGHVSDTPSGKYSNYNPAQTCITNQDHSISSDSSTWSFSTKFWDQTDSNQLTLKIDFHLYWLNWNILGKMIILTTNIITTKGPAIA